MRHSTIMCAALVASLAVVGCAPTVWNKPGITQAQFNQDNARCRLVARGMNSGSFYTEGKPAFVAGAALGNAIGTAVNTAATYNDCMMADGYTTSRSSAVSRCLPLSASSSQSSPECSEKSPGRALHAGSPWTLPAARRPDGLPRLRLPLGRPRPDSLPAQARIFTWSTLACFRRIYIASPCG